MTGRPTRPARRPAPAPPLSSARQPGGGRAGGPVPPRTQTRDQTRDQSRTVPRTAKRNPSRPAPRAAARPLPGSGAGAAARPAPVRGGRGTSTRRGSSAPPPRPSGQVARALGQARDVDSTASVGRFAARARAARLLALRPMLALLGVALLLAGVGWVLLASPWTRVESVGVVGADRVDAAAVTALVDPALGTPLVRVDRDALAARVEGLPLVTDAEVVRVWPSSLEVRLVERVPVAAVPAGDGVALLDAEGVVVIRQADTPGDLPLVQVDVDTAGAGALVAVTEVLAALPQDLAADVAAAGAGSPDDVWLETADGARVLWGSPDRGQAKADVLAVLRGQGDAKVYDVRAPGTPVTR